MHFTIPAFSSDLSLLNIVVNTDLVHMLVLAPLLEFANSYWRFQWYQTNKCNFSKTTFSVFCRESGILLIATLAPPSFKPHGGPDCGRQEWAGSPRRQIPFLRLRAPSCKDAPASDNQGCKERHVGKSVLEPAGNYCDLEPVSNWGEILLLPSKLAAEPALLAALSALPFWKRQCLKCSTCTSQVMNFLDWRD